MYARVFTARCNALLDVLDALLAAGSESSFAMLSQHKRFRRKRPSRYAAVDESPIESGVRFRKEHLGWTLPRFPHAETGDTWTLPTALAH